MSNLFFLNTPRLRSFPILLPKAKNLTSIEANKFQATFTIKSPPPLALKERTLFFFYRLKERTLKPTNPPHSHLLEDS